MKKIILLIAGEKENFSLEHRIFNSTSFYLTVFAFIASSINYMMELHYLTVWPGYAGGILSGLIYHLSRRKKIFTQALIFSYIFLTIAILAFMYFFNAGAGGTILYLLIMSLTIYLLVVPARLQWVVFAIFSVTIFVLLALEYAYPGWLYAYSNRKEQLLDHAITLSYSLFFTMMVIIVFRKGYINERKTVLQQNEDLLELNRQIDEQKAELQKKTIALEETVLMAQERNQRIETLLKELHHRVKNNLQIVSGLLSLQSNRMEDDAARLSLEASRTRIDAIALIHKGLYQEDTDAATVEINNYLHSLNDSLADSFGFDKNVVTTKVDIREPMVDIDLAIPVGLIINELVTNAFKHAFDGITEPEIKVSLFQKESNIFLLSVDDNGKGSAGPQDLKKNGSFGMKLVHTLVKQLNGSITISIQPGTHYAIELKT